MRETLTALAIVLIIALTGLLAGPYFIDWNASRGFLEARLSHALGQKVTVGGSIDLKLLPTPYLVLNQAVVGGDDGAVTVGIRHLDLELAVAPLLHGEFDIVEAQLAEPTIRINLQRDRSLPALPRAPAFDADVRFDRITVTDGTVAIADPESGRTLALDHFDLQAEADSLAGPFRAHGTVGEGPTRTGFRFNSAAPQNGRTRTRLVVEETPAHASLDLDGLLSLPSASPGTVSPMFEGTAILAGHLQGTRFDLLPWRLSAPLRGDVHAAQWTTGELRLGGEERSLIFAGSGRVRFGSDPELHLDLAAKQVDLDRLTSRDAKVDAEAQPVALADILSLRRFLQPPMPVSVALSVATATYGGAALGEIESVFTIGSAGASPLRLALQAPGGTRLSIDGAVSARATAGQSEDQTPAAETFAGHVALRASDLPVFAGWLSRVFPDIAVPAGPFRAIDAQAEARYGDGTLDLRALAVRLDRSVISGNLQVRAAAGARPPVVSADLQAAALDLQALPDLSAARGAGLDLDLRFEANGIKVARFGSGALDAGRIRLALKKSGKRFSLDTLRVENLGGATIGATGRFDADGGHLEATLDAGRLVDVAALAQRLAPGVWAEALVARAPVLAPAKLAVAADFATADAVPRHVSIAGTLGATKLDVTLSPDAADASKVVVTGAAEAPEGGVLLHQAGFPTLAVPVLGPGRVSVDARGEPGGAFTTSLRATVGATILEASGQLDLGPVTRAAGSVKLTSPDVAPVLQSLAVAFPDLIGRQAVALQAMASWTPPALAFNDLKGTVGDSAVGGALVWRSTAKGEPALSGSLAMDRASLPALASLVLGPAQQAAAGSPWSNAAFGTGLIDAPASAFDLKVKSLDLGRGLRGADATLNVDVARGVLILRGLKAGFAGGQIGADLTVRRDGVNAALEGKLTASDVLLSQPDVGGRLSAQLSLAGSGRSAQALASSLSGSGAATLDDLRIARADPSALPKVFADVEADRVSVDEDSILRALDDATGGALAAASRSFGLSLAAGILHGDAVAGPLGTPDAVRSTVALTFDLRRLLLDTRVEQTLEALPKDWSGQPPRVVLQFAGPLGSQTRKVDAGPFINALAARALARETARIEAYEADARERAFFNQRLQADRRREQDRLKAEEDARQAIEAARKAEAERRAREVAARLERARKAEEGARAAERAALDKAARERAEQQARDRAAQQRQAPEPAPAAPSGYGQLPVEPR